MLKSINTKTITSSIPSSLSLDQVWHSVLTWLTTSGIKLVIAIIILIIGWKVINKFIKQSMKILRSRAFDETVARFLETAGGIGLKIVLIITLLGYIGVNLAGLAALLASAGLAVGLALQGSLSNLAGGVIILVLRPFKVGDYIQTASGQAGTVLKIQIFYTHLLTGDNKEVMIPNGKLANESVTNYSSQDMRRVDLVFGIGYDDNIIQAKNILFDIVRNHKLIVNHPEPFIAVSEQAASSINFVVRAWCNNSDYWTVHFDLLEQVKLKFDEVGINIPYNQVDVHIKNK
ncbi:MAG: mechanosensitive ion channel family protein [Sarcina sp.]